MVQITRVQCWKIIKHYVKSRSYIYIYERVSSYTTNVINEILLDTKTYVFWRICDVTTWTMANNRGHGVYTVAQWKLTHKPKLRGMRIMNPLLDYPRT